MGGEPQSEFKSFYRALRIIVGIFLIIMGVFYLGMSTGGTLRKVIICIGLFFVITMLVDAMREVD